jgi:hypothetical protein
MYCISISDIACLVLDNVPLMDCSMLMCNLVLLWRLLCRWSRLGQPAPDDCVVYLDRFFIHIVEYMASETLSS